MALIHYIEIVRNSEVGCNTLAARFHVIVMVSY